MKTRVNEIRLEDSPLKKGEKVFVPRFGENVEVKNVRIDGIRKCFVYDTYYNGEEKAFFQSEVESDKLV